MRHDRQRLPAGKGFRLQAQGKAHRKADRHHGNIGGLPQRPRELHLRTPRHEHGKAQADVRQLPVHAWMAQGTRKAGRTDYGRTGQGADGQPPARRDKEH